MPKHDHTEALPEEPIHRILNPLERFLHVEAASGVVLLACTIAALILANSRFAEDYLTFWQVKVGFQIGSFQMVHKLQHWINDGLMAIFFFVIGLEVKRELVVGELRELRRAALPIVAAIGGMVVPAGAYLLFQFGEVGERGWGIPMATDIAFVVGCMAILGPRIPHGLRILLLSLAIADDIGAILVIAIGYTEGLNLGMLGFGLAGLAGVFLLSRLGVRSFGIYMALGIIVWFFFHESGVHATIAGVILGLMTPARSYLRPAQIDRLLRKAAAVVGEEWNTVTHRAARVRRLQWAARESISPLEYQETTLHPWVGFLIMPVFALANAGVSFELSDLSDPVATAVMAGLALGKPIGIFAFSWLAIKIGLAILPPGVNWTSLLGGGALAGIGFTMALFIAGLALEGDLLDPAKVGVLAGSVISAVLGISLLVWSLPKPGEIRDPN